MNIYLDSRDLIRILSRNKPMNSTDMATKLRDKNWQLVYSFKNICEVVLVNDLLETRRRLQELEQIPHTYIMSMPPLRCEEFRAAIAAYLDGTNPVSVNPFVRRWHNTYTYPGQQDYQEMLVNYSLADQVLPIVMDNPDVCRNTPESAEYLQRAVDEDRDVSNAERRNRERFESEVRMALAHCQLTIPTEEIANFAEWVRADPARCHGWRIFNETYLEFCANVGDSVDTGDISDYSHVICLPYVDAITLDRRMADYCQRAAMRLQNMNPGLSYTQRIYPNTEQWLADISSS